MATDQLDSHAAAMTSPTKTPLSMSEDQLLSGVTDALTAHKWMWHHVRRSDKALQMGHAGFPDVFALRGLEALALELKTAGGVLSAGQRDWGHAFDRARIEWWIVRPSNYDALLARIK